MMPVLWILGLFLATAFAGSPCPERETIYPCSCVNIRGTYGGSMTTVVQCHRLRDSDALNVIIQSLKTMRMDSFHLFDSFWDSVSPGEDDKRKTLPEDWLLYLKSKTIEIVDTPLPSCFACKQKNPCKNIETTRFTARNSTTSTKLCTLCDTGRSNSYPWISCMSKLRQLDLTHGKIESLDADFFPRKSPDLKVLNLSHNKIRTVNSKAFEHLSLLTSLDLSHNRIAFLDGLFPSRMSLAFLDLSWNSIEKLDDKFFNNLQFLKTFNVKGNHIVNLLESHWKNAPDSLKFIDLTENPLHCDCNITWINTTLPLKVFLKGHCATPEIYEKHILRFKANYLVKKCDKGGKLLPQKLDNKTITKT